VSDLGSVADAVGPISELGRRYLAGELRQHQLAGEIVLSRREDATHAECFSPAVRRDALELARQALRGGRLAFGVLAAGASSRMDLQQLPPEVSSLLRAGGRTELPSSKALVPVWEHEGEPLNYLDLFLLNVLHFQQQLGVDNHVLLFVSEGNRGEIVEHLQRVRYRGLAPERVWIFEQPLAPQIVATEEDVRRFERNFAEVDFEQVRAFSARYAGHDLPLKKPAGHGEFLHQLVASGMLGELAVRGVDFFSVRNIDNVAAVLDDVWSLALGHLMRSDAEMLVEVSQRPHGQKGGALIQLDGAWRLAEDPSFLGTRFRAADSYYMNNAVAILRPEYLYRIYDTDRDELTRYRGDDEAGRKELTRIAERGRRKFPTIVEAKPVNLAGVSVGAVVPETNMWESTGVVPGVRMVPFAVDSDQDAGEQLLELSSTEQRERACRVRFSPTKSWTDYRDPRKQCITEHVCRRIVAGQLVSVGP
jgi:hypothetical protein